MTEHKWIQLDYIYYLEELDYERSLVDQEST